MPRLDMTLVPIAVVELDLCAYTVAGDREGSVAFGGEDAVAVTAALNGLNGVDPFSGPRCLPQPPIEAVVLVSDGLHVEQVVVSRSGCGGVSNGLLSAPSTATWRGVLERGLRLAVACVRLRGPSGRCRATQP